MSIGSRIRALRLEKDLTQEDLARKISEKRANISSWETDRTKPELNSLKRLAEFFNVSTDHILYGGESNKELIPGSEVLILMDDGTGGHKIVDLTGLPIEEQKIIWDIISTYRQKHQK